MRRSDKLANRVQAIQTELLRNGKITVQELADRLNVSVATVRRDLTELQRAGGLRRTYGGAIPVEPLLYEPFKHDSTFQEQIERYAEEKRRIGVAAAELIQDGQMVAFTAGTTTTQVARSILVDRTVTIVTNTVNVAMELSGRPNISVIVTGGKLHGGWFSLVGPQAIHAVEQMVFDVLFIGVDALDVERGLMTHYLEEAALNSAMIRQARQKVVTTDHSKFGKAAHYVFGTLSDVDLIVTDTGAPESVIEVYEARGAKLKCV
jgi:DeoR family transcriptional regulator, aga operon transcriptional repressor